MTYSGLQTREGEPKNRIPFEVADKILDGKLSIARAENVRSQYRAGIVDYIGKNQLRVIRQMRPIAEMVRRQTGITKGVEVIAKFEKEMIRDASDFNALFNTLTFNEPDIYRVRETIAQGQPVLALFDSGQLGIEELFTIIFEENGLGIYPGEEILDFRNMHRINPGRIPNLEANLPYPAATDEPDQAVLEGHLKDMFTAYEKASEPARSRDPSVTFMIDENEVTRLGNSPKQDLLALAKGEVTFAEPPADFLRMWMQIENGLRKIFGSHVNYDGLSRIECWQLLQKAWADGTIDQFLPGTRTATSYLNHVFPAGNIMNIRWFPPVRKYSVDILAPGLPFDQSGPRVALPQAL